jgi:hypothetical protein
MVAGMSIEPMMNKREGQGIRHLRAAICQMLQSIVDMLYIFQQLQCH